MGRHKVTAQKPRASGKSSGCNHTTPSYGTKNNRPLSPLLRRTSFVLYFYDTSPKYGD
uniref:Uncharacterized protein n=1 Tax=Arion vulgaris TaxID=1028688 RepID=A0A0B7A9K3_9EUPU